MQRRPPWRPVPEGLRVTVRLTPKAGRTAVIGVVALADGTPAIKASVPAPPVDGAANAALVKLLAKTWRLPKSSITIVGGAGARTKVVGLAGDAAGLARRLADWLAATGGKAR